ncbi:MAG: UvrD-helicase domain-containing protein [Spirochaetia bacterium]|nr:UvrD-helicase domain-containing protein [Spirochaetia bacterium]
MEMNHVTYISAGAGSGKTYTLTTFLSELITKKGVKPEEFILTTFTEAATAEFKEKARAKIFECTDYEQYAQVAERLNQAIIGTVDSVSYRFVMKYWYLLGISPNLKLLDDETTKFFINQNLQNILTAEESDFLKSFVDDFEVGYSYGSDKYGKNYDFWKEDVKDIMEKSKSFDTDMSENLKVSLEYANSLLGDWPLSYDKNNTKDIMALLDEFAEVNANSPEGDQRNKRDKAIKDWRHDFSNGASYLAYQSFAKALQGRPPLADYRNCPHFQAVLSTLSHIYDSKEVKEEIVRYIELIFDLVNRLTMKYEDYKKEHHAVDYVDIENHFLKLLDIEEVKEDIRENFKYVFVDEFQDSSPTQVKMFEKLSAIVGRDEDDDYKITIGKNTFNLHNSVWVGDFKQAIYGFRGADTALTKAVADIIEANMKTKPKQFSMHSLDTSYRSYQQIVDKTNEIFEYSFSGILSPENVHLNHNRAQPVNFDSLRTWTLNGNNASERLVDLCDRLEKLVLKTRDPSKIAVLARNKTHYEKIIDELRKRNIPVSIETEIEPSCDEVQLIIALLRLVINPYDAYSRALVTFLTEKDFDAGKVIDSKLDFSENYKKAKEKGEENLPEYLSKKTIISKFMEKKSVFSSQTIHSLVESLIIELDLFNLCRNWDSAEISDVILQALADAAGKYEELCAASAIPPTISGYIAYISDKKNLKSGGSKNGIVFMTIHKSKGLEWDHVILLSLKSDESEIGQFIKHEVFGVSFYHKDAPSSENLYPPMIVNLFPTIITGSYGIPQCIQDSIQLRSSRYNQQLADLTSEVRRLWYVAITRARDILILIKEGRTPYAALNLIEAPSGWEAGFVEDDDNLKEGEKYVLTTPPVLSLNVQESKSHSKRNIQPSGYTAEKKFIPKTVYKSDHRIPFGKGESESNVIGSCIHDIFCVLEKNKTPKVCERIIEVYELKDILNDPAAIIKAWDNFADFLKKEYGDAVSVAHELNFTQGFDGHIVNGSIDYIYRTSKGTVLIDFKTFPGKESDIINEGKHCAANYSGQFQCYQKALEANGETVIARLVYYPVGGLVVELK